MPAVVLVTDIQTPAWDDPRYTRQHATSGDPPYLGYPPIDEYIRHHAQVSQLPTDFEQLRLSQVYPLVTAAQLPDGALERLAQEHARHEVEQAGRRVVVSLRFWWWREEIEVDEPGEPAIPGVRMLAVALAVSAP